MVAPSEVPPGRVPCSRDSCSAGFVLAFEADPSSVTVGALGDGLVGSGVGDGRADRVGIRRLRVLRDLGGDGAAEAEAVWS